MSEKEKEIATKICIIIPTLPLVDMAYVLGQVEHMAVVSEKRRLEQALLQ